MSSSDAHGDGTSGMSDEPLVSWTPQLGFTGDQEGNIEKDRRGKPAVRWAALKDAPLSSFLFITI